jgi:hypothetical protein
MRLFIRSLCSNSLRRNLWARHSTVNGTPRLTANAMRKYPYADTAAGEPVNTSTCS